MSRNSDNPKNHGAVIDIAQIIKAVMSLAAESEISALYLNSQQAIPALTCVIEMGHHQLLTMVQTDNTTALGFVLKILQPKVTKSTDMKFWWMHDCSVQEQFCYYWEAGKFNDSDYWTDLSTQ